MEKKTIVLGTYGESWTKAHSACVTGLQLEFGLVCLETVGHCQIDIARSLLATAALQQGADVVFFVDHDILFEPIDVLRLADMAREGKGIVGAPYSQRRMGAGIVGAIDSVIGKDPENGDEVAFGKEGGVYPAKGVVGMGFTAIHREVFRLLDELPEMAPRRTREGMVTPYFEKIVVDGHWLHEDASFCHRAREAGALLSIDTRVRVTHRGTHDFGIEDAVVRATPPETLRLRLR